MSVLLRVVLVLLVAVGPLRAFAATGNVVLIVGDSISSAYGMPPDKGWVKLLASRIVKMGFPHQVVNASVSGDTSASAASRLPMLLRQHRPAVVVIEIGGNDGLRGLPLANTRKNLNDMVRNAKKTGAAVLLLGIDVPPNLGAKYAAEFRGVYGQIAKANRVALVPGFLAKVGQDPDLMQSDGIHPNQFAQPALVDTVWPELEKLLAPVAANAAAPAR